MEDATKGYPDEIFCSGPVLIAGKVLRFLAAFHIFLAITSTFGNVVILTALHKATSRLHPPSKILLRSLALTDFCVGILLEPIFVVHVTDTHNKTLEFCFRFINLEIFIGQVLCFASLFTLTAISVDRLLALLLGIRYRQVVTVRRVKFILICLWILSIGFAAATFWHKELNFYYTITADLLCVVVSTCCYAKIYQKLLYHQAQIQENVHQGQPNGYEPLNIARYRKTVSSALWLLFSVLTCYLPIGIVMTITIVEGWQSQPLIGAWTLSTTTLMMFNSTLNPILYCWKIREVRRAVVETFKQIWCCSSN